MNYTIIPAKAVCTKCNYEQPIHADHCKSCGISFVFGKKDAWQQDTFQQIVKTYETTLPVQDSGLEYVKHMMAQKEDKLGPMRCMWDNVPPGQAMGMVCPCPKCSPYSMGGKGY